MMAVDITSLLFSSLLSANLPFPTSPQFVSKHFLFNSCEQFWVSSKMLILIIVSNSICSSKVYPTWSVWKLGWKTHKNQASWEISSTFWFRYDWIYHKHSSLCGILVSPVLNELPKHGGMWKIKQMKCVWNFLEPLEMFVFPLNRFDNS